MEVGIKRPDLAERNKIRKGWHHSKKARRKISQAQIGRKHSEETIAKLSGENNYNWKGGQIKLKGRRKERLEEVAGRKRPDKCEVCQSGSRICFDHNHKTGKFRGWLCECCNLVLGFAKDNPETLIKLSKYLRTK